MQALVIEDYCIQPNFKLVSDFEKPSKLKENQVLVKLKAASVNPVDYKMRNGATRKATPVKFPGVIGMFIRKQSLMIFFQNRIGWKWYC